MSFINTLRGYAIVFSKSAERDLEKLPTKTVAAIRQKLTKLTQGANNLDILKLVGYVPPTYRLRVGNYRVLFEIHEHEIIILIVGAKHRKDVY